MADQRYYCQSRINRILYSLQNRSGLISIDRGTDTVRRINFENGGETALIPAAYWQHGWQERLSVTAKHFYLISLAETKASPFYPWWRRSMLELKGRYGCDHGIGAGARELANFNILEMPRSPRVLRGGKYSQEAQYYRLNPFYDMADFERRLAGLCDRFSQEAVHLAQEMASLFFSMRNLEVIEAICLLIEKRGPQKVASSQRRIAALPLSSARRTISYLEEILG